METMNECAQCNHVFSASDKEVEECPKCMSEDIIFDIEALDKELEEEKLYGN